MRITFSTFPFAAACLLGGSLWAQTPAQSVFLSPNTAESGIPFQVAMSGTTTLCHPLFSHYQATPGTGTLQLSVVAENDPAAKCPAGDHDYTTDFPIPALKAGDYAVTLSLMPACAYSATPCPFALMIQNAGTLQIKDSADLFFAIRPKHADAGKEFDLFVTHKQYSCANEFTNLSSHISGHSLFVQFTNRVNPGIACAAADIKAYGPIFKVTAPAGVYQVFTTAQPYCTAICPDIVLLPQLSGALTVTGGTAPILSREKTGASRTAGTEMRDGIGSRNGALRLDAHGATGKWRGKVNDLAGRRE